MNKTYFVYILTNQRNGTLYTGVTSDLIKRIYQHKQKQIIGFTERYALNHLVWYECHQEIEEAILREKRIKKWNRQWKLSLIDAMNPTWVDLYDSLLLDPRFRGACLRPERGDDTVSLF